jgi:hypothetical protein
MKRDKDNITIDDLLRLKRAERPPAEFWSKFDSEMRAKQLSAIVSKRPWWDGISRGFAGIRRLQLPMGAAAALALTWVGVHYSGDASGSVQQLSTNATPSPAAASVQTPSLAPAKAAVAVHGSVEVAAVEVAPAETAVVAPSSSHIVQAPLATVAEAASASPFADGIAVTLADYRNSAPDLPRTAVFGSDRDFEPTVAASRKPAAEPLAQMDPAEERRARLLAPALPAGPRTFAADWMKERASSDDRMYESMDDGHSASGQALVGFRF